MPDLPELPALAAPAALPSPEPAADAAREKMEAAVNAWLVAHIYNSPLSRSSDAWACLHAALPALIDSLSTQN
jgi:hypothetical protein